MAKRNERLKRQRRRFWEANPHCYWCGIPTILLDAHPANGHLPANTATIDHLDSKLDSRRGTFSGETRHVLACHKCNGNRCRIELDEQRALQRIKSGHPYAAAKRGNLPRNLIPVPGY